MADFLGFELKEFDSSTLTANYQNLGSPLSTAAKSAYIINNSDVDVYISVDGVTNTFKVPSGYSLPILQFYQHNAQSEGSYAFRKKTQFTIKQVTGVGTGDIIVQIYT